MRKIVTVFCIVLGMVMLSSCGKYSAVREKIDEITVENNLPEAASGAVTLEEAGQAVYEQQLALCDMYIETSDKTDLDAFLEDYQNLDKSKLLSLLNDAREDINKENCRAFEENMAVLLADVEDCQNIYVYIQKREAEVIAFYDDYRKLGQKSQKQYKVLCDMLLKYQELGNWLADMFLQEHQEEFAEAAVEAVEANAEVTSDFRAAVNKSNEIIAALNAVYGGTDAKKAERINAANKKLVVKLLNSMETLSDSERKSLLEQLENGGDMTIEMEKTPKAGTKR